MEFRNKIADHCRRHSILYWFFSSQPEKKKKQKKKTKKKNKKKKHHPLRIKFISYQERYSTQMLMNEPWEDNLITISFSHLFTIRPQMEINHIFPNLDYCWQNYQNSLAERIALIFISLH